MLRKFNEHLRHLFLCLSGASAEQPYETARDGELVRGVIVREARQRANSLLLWKVLESERFGLQCGEMLQIALAVLERAGAASPAAPAAPVERAGSLPGAGGDATGPGGPDRDDPTPRIMCNFMGA